MNRLIKISFLCQLFASHWIQADIFFSEYAEGSSHNKYLEIYNTSKDEVDLSEYALPSVTNAPSTPGQHERWNAFPSGAKVGASGIYVVLNQNADDAIKLKVTSDISTFSSSSQEDSNSLLPYHTLTYLSNGDDGFKLVKGSEADFEVIDSIGDWQADPGTAWAVAGVNSGTKDHTLIRKPSVLKGEPDWAASAGENPEGSQWIVLDIDAWDDLGQHTIDNPIDNQPGPDGSGSTILLNTTPQRSHWESGSIFKDGVSGSVLELSFTGNEGYLTAFQITWPAALGVLAEENLQLSGDGFTEANLSFDSPVISITGCKVDSVSHGKLTISGFITPAEATADSFGNYAIVIRSSGEGAEFKEQAVSPTILIPVSISSIRQNDQQGVPLAQDKQVVVDGTVSAFGLKGQTEGYILKDGSGIRFTVDQAFDHSWFNQAVYLHGLVGHSNGTTHIAVDSGSIFLQEVEALEVEIISRPTAPSNAQGFNLLASVNGGTPPFTYSWSLGDGLLTAQEKQFSGYLPNASDYPVNLQITDSNGASVTKETTLKVDAADSYSVPEKTSDIRIASFNIYMNRNVEGDLKTELKEGTSSQASRVAEIIQVVNPDIVLLNEFDYDSEGEGLAYFKSLFLEVSQNGNDPVEYPYTYFSEFNTGAPSGLDLDNDGTTDGKGDSFGYASFPGQYGMVLLSKYPILLDQIRTFQKFLWKDMPEALLPKDPVTGENWFDDQELEVVRLSSKNHWDVPIEIDGNILHLLCSHATPPVFDGPEDRNGKRNHDEIRFWADYVDPDNSNYIYDDSGIRGGIAKDSRFVLLGDQNADPVDLDGIEGTIQQVLDSPFFNSSYVPASPGGHEFGKSTNGIGNPAFYTASFRGRVDYVLPSLSGFEIDQGSVFWPKSTSDLSYLTENNPVSSSDHRLVWLDLSLSEITSGGRSSVSPSRKTIEEVLQNSETIEGALVQISGLNLKDSNWDDIGQKQTFVISDSTGDINVRNPADALFSESQNPGSEFQLIALLVQEDTEEPLDSGYYLLPRQASDFFPGFSDNPVKEWISQNLTGSDPNLWQTVMLEDTDNDSIPNALEYALGSSPSVADSSYLPKIESSNDFGILLTRLKGSVDPNLNIEVLGKKSLADEWSQINFETRSAIQGVSQENLPDGNAFVSSSFERVKLVPDPSVLGDSGFWFFSLRVTVE